MRENRNTTRTAGHQVIATPAPLIQGDGLLALQ